MGTRIKRVLFGERPRLLIVLAAPTAFAVILDVAFRANALAAFAPRGKAIYASSTLLSAALWVLPLWVAARLMSVPRMWARGALGMLCLFWLLPFATLAYAGQVLYFRLFHAYMGRDTLRLGIALRGTVRDWFASWGGPPLLLGMAAAGVVLASAIIVLVRRSARSIGGPVPAFPAVAFASALVCCWMDGVDSRFLQAATPDVCFAHGVVHAARVVITGKGDIHQGMAIRSPLPLPPLARVAEGAPDVLVILTESVRSDALCSAPPPACAAPFLDDVVAARIPLGKLTSQTPNTFSSFLVLTTGLRPNVSFQDAHRAPVLWEVAHAVGYRTAYVTSQNPKYEDFGAFTRRAGIDTLTTAADLGGLANEQAGAPDERATAAMTAFVRDAAGSQSPYFAVLHLSNTHAPYRTDPSLEPFVPSSDSPLGNAESFHNRYRNAVRMQERTVASFLRELAALPGWDKTVVVFASDHGEQFREHGGLYHNHSLFDEELRVPGWLCAGPRALSMAARHGLSTYAGHRTTLQDVHATLLDLLGVYDDRGALPLSELVGGRSLLRPRPCCQEPVALLATSTAVWEPDDAWYGVLSGERVTMARAEGPWTCFDTAKDPRELSPRPGDACADLAAIGDQAFACVRARQSCPSR